MCSFPLTFLEEKWEGMGCFAKQSRKVFAILKCKTTLEQKNKILELLHYFTTLLQSLSQQIPMLIFSSGKVYLKMMCWYNA
jgi:hypothetical protein